MKVFHTGIVLVSLLLVPLVIGDTVSQGLPLRKKSYGHPDPYSPAPKPYGSYTPSSYSPKGGYHHNPLPRKGYQPSPKPYGPTPAYHPAKPIYHSTPKPIYHSTPKPIYHSTPKSSYHSTPEPNYHSTPSPTYHPTPTPVYHPTPTPVYHPKPTPVYKSTPKPVYTPTPSYHPEPKYNPGKPAYRKQPKKAYHPQPKSYEPVQPAPVHHHDDEYNEIPHNYAFGYAVKDGHSGDDFSHSETRDGHKTEGEYRVALPDGRTQIVSYYADENGYHADVKYEGEAIPHPEGPRHSEPYIAPKAYNPKDSYSPPAHQPSPYVPQHKPTPAPYVPTSTPTYTPAPYHPQPTPTYAPLAYKAPVTPLYPSPGPYKPAHPKPRYHKQSPVVYRPKPDPYQARIGRVGPSSLRG